MAALHSVGVLPASAKGGRGVRIQRPGRAAYAARGVAPAATYEKEPSNRNSLRSNRVDPGRSSIKGVPHVFVW
jgi:hypothetical protein